VLPVPAEWLHERGNKVQIAVAGGGEAFWSVSLIGFARGFRDADRASDRVQVDRVYLAAPRRFGDRDAPAGFSVVAGSGYQTWRNTVRNLRVGETARAEVGFFVRREEDRARMTPLVLEEPIPAGCSVARGSIQGDFEQVDVQPDRLVFFFRDGVHAGTVAYELQARFAGRYRVLPAHVYAALRPELAARGAVGELAISAGEDSAHDDYRPTPDELWFLGKASFDAAQALAGEPRKAAVAAASEQLGKLVADWQQKDWRLRDEVWKEVARMMLFLGIERGDSRTVVKYFEELKDRWAELVIPFDKILAVGQGYVDLGEFESALLVFRAAADASFLKDAAVATTLEGLGEVKAATEFLERLLLAYPDLGTMRIARYSIGQKLAALAASIDPAQPVDEKVGTAEQLRAHAVADFREFLLLCPEDPLAEEVSFAWATTLLEGKDLKQALGVAEAALQRYAESPFADELLYTQGYAQFALGNHDAAFAALQRVATGQFPNDKGGRGPSENKWNAIYLQGQIHHARGEVEQALADYAQVKDRFTDAVEATDYFRQRLLSLPEVATFPLAQQAQLELTFRNVDKATLQVFQVDLMRLYLLEKSLNDIRGIRLQGIKPLLVQELQLGNGRDYRSVVRQVPLELKEPGAYLAVVRGGDCVATGMLLRSDLAIEAQEQCDVGRIRVNVKQGSAPLADAEVKVVGSGDSSLRGGDTDLRGVFAADGLCGLATVIARKGPQFAFYRGTAVHRPEAFRRPAVQEQAQQQGGNKEAERRKDLHGFDALQQNLDSNTVNRGRQVDWLNKNVLNKQQKGVEVYRAK
jgi:tetratricopeptide (TPR) repeat protein